MPHTRGFKNAAQKSFSANEKRDIRREGGLRQYQGHAADWPDHHMSKRLAKKNLPPGEKVTHPQAERPHYLKRSTKSMMLPWDLRQRTENGRELPYFSVAPPAYREKKASDFNMHVLGGKSSLSGLQKNKFSVSSR
ncbi:hypothetical protein RCL1_007105 [Eukaryota sp. TZLM3-RCL]